MPHDFSGFKIDQLLTDVGAVIRHPLKTSVDIQKFKRIFVRESMVCPVEGGGKESELFPGSLTCVQGLSLLPNVHAPCGGDDPADAFDTVLKAAAMVAPVPFRAVEFINDAMFRG